MDRRKHGEADGRIPEDLAGEAQMEALMSQLQRAEKAVSEAGALLQQLERSQLHTLSGAADSSRSIAGGEARSVEHGYRLIPVKDWPEHHGWPTVGGLRHLIYCAGSNGFEKVIRRVGNRILIHERAFFEWVEERNQGGGGRVLPEPTRRSQSRAAKKKGA